MSQFVEWEIDFCPSTTLMKPLLRLPPGDSSCADNFGLSYLVTVQTGVNAGGLLQVFVSAWVHFFSFLFSRLKPDGCG